MANDKIRLNAPSVAGGKDVSTHTLASGEDLGRSALAIYTPGAGSTPGTAADIDDTNPLPTKLIDIGTAATDAHLLDAVAALGDILAALGATLGVSGSVSVSNFPATQTVSGTVTANLGTIGAAATAANQATEIASLASIDAHVVKADTDAVTISSALPAGTNVIGHVVVDSAGNVSVTSLPSIPAGSNTIGKIDQGAAGASAWPVSLASLPAFAATPTVNLGTLNGAATDASITNGNLRGTVALSGTLPAFASPPAVTASWASAQHVIVDTAPTTAVTNANLDAALSTLATQATLSALNTKIPSSPATDRATAVAPFAVRLSDGSAFLSALPITDNSGSLTVDAPVGTPVFVRLSDGSSAVSPALEGGNLATLAGIVSGGKGLVTETSASAILSALTGSGTLAGWTTFLTTALLTSSVPAAVLKASAGTIASFFATNGTGATCYLQIHNATSTASLSDSTLKFSSPASTNAGITAAMSIPTGGISCSTGIVVAWSTTQYSYTSPGSTSTGGAVGSYK